ncbi:MAG: flavodoxin family protein [Oscillospiraceae bacterium]|nr:flavodoxin family protein [Oscillospiraceae bacterium]
MKVVAVNGSPRTGSNTGAAIEMVFSELRKENIETELINIGNKPFRGCTACAACHKIGYCAFDDGAVEIIDKMRAADGIIIGSPVYYAGINGTLKSFLDRAFFSSGTAFRFKPCASVVVARRSGVTAAIEQINKYFQIAEMLITPTIYWSGIHGGAPGEVSEDIEGAQMMTQIGKNMAYLLKIMEGSKAHLPDREQKIKFSYIR